jgi:hypothetical protein
MKRTGVLFAGTFFLVCGAVAQAPAQSQPQSSAKSAEQTSTQAQNEQTNAALAGGWTINAELTSSIDAKKAKQGDIVTAKTTEAIKANGKTILPSGTKLVGQLTQVSARAKGDPQSALGIAFDKAILKNGEEVPLNVTIQALATANAMQSANAANDMATTSSGGTSPMNPGTPVNSGVPGGVSPRGRSTETPATTAINPRETSASTLSATGKLTPSSRGVFGLQGASLNATTANGAKGSVITSDDKNLHLDSGTQLLLVTQSRNADAAPKS